MKEVRIESTAVESEEMTVEQFEEENRKRKATRKKEKLVACGASFLAGIVACLLVSALFTKSHSKMTPTATPPLVSDGSQTVTQSNNPPERGYIVINTTKVSLKVLDLLHNREVVTTLSPGDEQKFSVQKGSCIALLFEGKGIRKELRWRFGPSEGGWRQFKL